MPRLATLPHLAVSQIRDYLRGADLGRCYIDQLADHYGLSPSGLRRRVRRAGTTIQRLKDEERYRRLEEMIARPRIHAKVAAEELGYSNAEGFCRFFRSHMGMTLNEHHRQRAAA